MLEIRYSQNKRQKNKRRRKRSNRQCVAIWAVVAENKRKINGENGDDLLQAEEVLERRHEGKQYSVARCFVPSRLTMVVVLLGGPQER